ncbi:restriction endonuclease subunit S [Enterococcus mundtii]|uniref:restriction endonuclease subunit S n=1 Tax=Enterococcus mundtii TaxID=53346 RepID=UPI00403D1FE7
MREKNAPKLRFNGFLEDWEQRKLGELATIVRGASPRPIQDPKWFDTESDIGWLRIADVTEQDGRIYSLEQHISKLGQEKTRVLTEPHLLLSIAATVGKPVVNYVKTGVHDGFLIFLNAIFDQEFMFQWLEMFRPKWQKYGQPGSQVNLNSELVRNQEMLIPINEEQQKIGSFFKQLDDTIALHQRKIEQLKLLKQAFLQKMLANQENVPELRFADFDVYWEQHTLEETTDIRAGRDYKHLKPGNIPVYGTGGYMLSVDDALSFEKDAIGIGRKGTIDNPYILKAPFWTVDTLFYVIPRNGYEIDFFYSIFQKINWKSKDESTGVPSLSKATINSILVYAPSKDEQKKIGVFFKYFDENILINQHKVNYLKQLKKAFLQKMFI